jgi:uncharacterized membrane protein YoaK (UPF0700 family)
VSHAAAAPVRLDPVVLLLSVTTGVVDSTAFLYLGGVFNSVVTGSMVVLGLSVARSSWGTALRAGEALLAYTAGALAAGRLSGRFGGPDRAPRPSMVCLAVELAALAGLWVAWLVTAGHPRGGDQPVLIALGGVGMGMQSVAVSALGRSGVVTTYLTGAVTRLVAGLADPTRPTRVGRGDRDQLLAFAGVVVGALLGAVLDAHVRPVGPLAAVLGVTGSIALLWRRRSGATP